MPDYYVAPESGSNSNNGLTANTPVRDWNAAAIGGGTFAPGDRVFFRAGEVYNAAVGGRVAPAFSSSPTQLLPVVFSTYGGTQRAVIDGFNTRDIGFRPAVAIDQTNGPRWLTVENFEVRNTTSHGITIGEVLDTGVTQANNTVRNCYIHNCGGLNNPALHIYGQGVTVVGNIVDNVRGDGILIRGRGYCGYNRVTRVARGGGDDGDCIQFDGGFSNSIIEYNVLDKDLPAKQALLFVGSLSQVRYNKITASVDVEGAGLLVVNSGNGVYVVGNHITGNDGIFVLDATGQCFVFGNVLIGRKKFGSRTESCGIDVGTTFTHQHRIHNNFVSGFNVGIFARNTFCRNNIVTGCQVGIDLSVGSAADSNNYAFLNDLNISGAEGPNSSTSPVNAQYVNSDGTLVIPPGTTPANLATANPLAQAGFFISANALQNGKMRSGLTPVGAFLPVLPRALRN